MNLLRTSVLNGIATLVKIGTAIGLNKALAVYVGPAGYAMIGQFSNAIAMSGAVAGGAVASGITQTTASHTDDPVAQRSMWGAASRLAGGAAMLLAVALAVAAEPVADVLLGSRSQRGIVLLLAALLPLMTANTLLLAVLNGMKEIRRYVLQNIAASVLGAALSIALAATLGLQGALAALVLNQSVSLLATLWLCRGLTWFTLSSFTGRPGPQAYRTMRGFAAMALTSAIAAPLSQTLVRSHLMASFGETAAGEWQAVFKISEVYLLFFTSVLGVYYLPRLAELRTREELFGEIRHVYRLLLPLCSLTAFAIWQLRQAVTSTLFTQDFLGMVHLFGWQLVGDVLKIGSWVLGYVMVGRAMVRWFIGTEIVFNTSWVALTHLLTEPFGLQGAVMAFALNYALYWLFLVWLITQQAWPRTTA